MEVTCQALPACSEQRSASCVTVAVTTTTKQYSMQYWLITATALAWQSCGSSGIGP